jgi:predicted PurR-regulated permease PerM
MVGGALSTVLVLAATVAVLLDGEHLVAAVRRLVPPVG